MINIGIDYNKEMICDLFYQQVRRLTQETCVKNALKRGVK